MHAFYLHTQHTYSLSLLPRSNTLLSLLQLNPFLSHKVKVKNGNALDHLHPSRLFHDEWPTMHQDCVRLEMALWSTLDAREAMMAIWKTLAVHLRSGHSKVSCYVYKYLCVF